jgi:hypothetical protein
MTGTENIGPKERRRRLLMGAGAVAVGGLIALGMIAAGAPRAWRIGLFFPFWMGALGVFQARENT